MTLFQFDYDLTFSVFFMNADKTLYGRYGTRSSVQEATRDISMEGLAAAMSATLALHAEYPGNRESLLGKQAVETKFKTPDDYPSLRGKFTASLDYDGAVTKSCMHCHQVRDAERQIYRDAGQPVPDDLLFPNPLPIVVGLQFDPASRATVTQVTNGSPAEVAGFQIGDEVMSLDGQPIVSLADTQWVLHNAASADALDAIIRRGDQRLTLQLELAEGWRRHSDISWRVSTWPLRRMVTGGMVFEPATAEQRKAANVADTALALVVKRVGQYGPHAAAKKAGFQEGDLMVSYDGMTKDLTTSQLLAYAVQNTKPGAPVPIIVVRDGKQQTLNLPMQK